VFRAAPVPAAREAVALGDVTELGRLPGDTVPDRRWRILAEPGGFTLQCDALVPGGWMNVHRDPTIPGLRRFGAWLGLSIGPVEVAPEPADLVAIALFILGAIEGVDDSLPAVRETSTASRPRGSLFG
jgi:hypothetical protein